MKRILLIVFWQFCLLPGGPALATGIVTLKDGRTVTGQIESATAAEIRLKAGNDSQALAIDQIQSIRFDHSLHLPADTEIAVRTIDPIDSDTADKSHDYAASVDDPVMVDGVEVIPATAKAVLRVAEVTKPSGLKKVTGRTSMSLVLVAVFIDGQRVEVNTGGLDSKSGTKAKRTAGGALIGAGGGAAIGAAAGGPAGAAIGAGAGAVAGAAGGLLTGKSTVKIASETRFTYKLSQPVERKDQPTVLPASPAADTLTLPDGKNVEGNWAGIDGGNISFVVNSQTVKYPAAQVSAVTFAAAPPPLPSLDATPAKVRLGLSIEQVVSILGQPTDMADLGAKKIYSYAGLHMKITFVDGKVTDIE